MVEGSGALRDERVEQSGHLGRGQQRQPVLAGGLQRDGEVLAVQLDPEARFVPAFEHPLPMDLEHLGLREAAQQRDTIAAIEAGNAELREQLDVYETDAWLDYAQSRARRDLNLANPGETVLMVRWGPRQPGTVTETTAPTVECEPANWRKWLDVFTPQ